MEVLRSAIYSYAEMKNQGIDVSALGMALKVEGVKLAKEICDKCMTLHGGIGTVVETGIERYYRDVKMFDLACGSNFTIVNNASMMVL